ncbi:hypothetical protein Psi01_17460 [Planobispora siamensis]|uniref:Uncharacterized protein n=1 Tax=Planobispora siamensis TaxID=936338 RepID=A0A8J3SEG4_9ACTN|nr:hypothetical protein [Planobispora siamensis]GIH91116.1 hypothetical protein Psi01_17460 [Planobispora siamensis]
MPEESRPKTDDNDPLLRSVAEENQDGDGASADEDENLEDLQ